MSYVRQLEYWGKLYAKQNITRYDDIEAYTSQQVQFQPMDSGVISITSLNQVGLVFYIGTSVNIDTSTGIPLSYLYTATNTLTFTPTPGTIYIMTVKGTATSISGSSFRIKYDSFQYVETELTGITNFSGQKIIDISNSQYYKSIIVQSITFVSSGTAFVASTIPSSSNFIQVSATRVSIDPDTGKIPTSYEVTHTDYTGQMSAMYGWKFDVTAGTTYYIYIFSSMEKFEIDYANLSGSYISTINATITDDYGNTQGLIEESLKKNNLMNSSYNSGHVYDERQICWVPQNLVLTIYGTTYARAKFRGWYSDANCTQLMSNCPYMTYVPTSTTVNIYGKVDLELYDFSFSTLIATYAPFRITADEWNDFISYCAWKYNNHTSTGESFSAYYIKAGDRLTAAAYNRIKHQCIDRIVTTVLDPTGTVAVGDAIYASYINNLLTEAQSL